MESVPAPGLFAYGFLTIVDRVTAAAGLRATWGVCFGVRPAAVEAVLAKLPLELALDDNPISPIRRELS